MAFQVPSKLIKASRLLSVSLLLQADGASAIANSLGYNRQYVHKWMVNGYVPLVRVWDVAMLLDVSQWALSYHKLAEVFGKEAPNFAQVVQATPLLPAQKEIILALLK